MNKERFSWLKQSFSLHSLRGKLIVFFLVISLIPLIGVGIIAYNLSQDALRKEAFDEIEAVRDLKASQIEAYFDNVERDIQAVARFELMNRAALGLTTAANNLGLEELRNLGFLGHPEMRDRDVRKQIEDVSMYGTLHRQYYPLFSEFIQNRGAYADVLLISLDGNVVYSYAKRDDFATNLLEGPYSSTHLADVFRELSDTAETGRIAITDYAPYPPADNEFISFVGSPVVDENDRLLGILVYALSLDQISQVVDDNAGLDTVESYLVGSDKKKRTGAGQMQEQVDNFAVEQGLQGITSSSPIQDGEKTLFTAYQPLELAGLKWVLITEEAEVDALAGADRVRFWMIVGISGAAVVIVIAGLLIGFRIANPIARLTDVARQVTGGDLTIQAEVESHDETGELAKAFNSMTTQLRDLIASLEQRILNRTRRLEIVATLGEQLNAILDENELLQVVVDQTKAHFGYYHAHIYLFDESGENLVVAAGTGQAGDKMVADRHRIPLKAETSLVARAARTGETVTVNDVQQAKDWLPNPLLPDTEAEMAVPIMQKGQAIGVLDVQQNKVGGLDDDDANLLRSLVNQIAVALTNARLFDQTNQAKEAAELAQKDIEIANKALETQVWQTSGLAELNDKMQGEQDVAILANSVVQQLCHYLNAQIGALYVADDNRLKLVGTYAYGNKELDSQFKFGEGLVGQAAQAKKPMLITDVPDNHLVIRSSFGELVPKNIMVFPFMYEGQVVGVIELGMSTEFNQAQQEFLQTALISIAIAFNTAQARARINELLAKTQQQAEELQTQSEELRVANEELETQTRSLRASQVQLKEKQAILDHQNQDLKVAQAELEQKAEELATASKYKSEFLANMSHELRTPLNSLLILARLLADNKEGNLTEEQAESAQIIYSGGTDLLNLINDILDLSKVEAGQMVFNFEPMPLTDLVSAMRTQFDHVAEDKGLDFSVNLTDNLPGRISTDPQRIKQVVKNLLSNAFKFTSEGSVSLNIYRPAGQVDLSRSGLDPGQTIAISVVDTGIGMTAEQQKVIFEAFQQADGSTSRQYGGTGLGLSISRELVSKLGGQIAVESEPGQGSTFVLYLPLQAQTDEGAEEPDLSEAASPTAKKPDAQTPAPVASKSAGSAAPPPDDDRDELAGSHEEDTGVKILVIIEDDPQFAKVLYDYSHKKDFKCLIAGDGKTGLELIRTYHPDAIILDLNLPDISGWEVLTVLKNDPQTRHVPIHIISVEDHVLDAYRKGAMGYLTKPVSQESLDEAFIKIEELISREIKALLVVEDDDKSRLSIKKLLGGSDVKISETGQGKEALKLLKQQIFDCMILDLSLPDMTGFDVLNQMNSDEAIARCPVIVYTGRDLTSAENKQLMQYADSVIVKGVKSPERLLDETALFLHRVVADMPTEKQETIHKLYDGDALLKGKKIMIVDDDMRNSFALSKLLSEKGMVPSIAHNGQKALDLLTENGSIDLILMDIMMPVLDGHETIKKIRAQQKFKTLPILALTAKAMKGDREKCLAVGANDYLSKPIDVDRLLSMLRVWLYQ